ncbi:hypothetical protein A4H97_21470 [Niastella yeongjuensis]|uniref:PTS sugar transporter subunit IIBC n=1 Tax=Niastella yeongjuensis TaxID=354355 RepID=A0A1V9F8E9_9BACT|nr:hypothetical protein A4H97_21470 [Niastella yeongjuensis]SEN98354.1 hypothetical protein SAMN05660816_01807 [Niastella yeongjuensis]
MNQLHENSRNFSIKKVSIDRAMKVLGQNGIHVNREIAEIILDFLYVIAKTYKTQKRYASDSEHEPNK